MNAALRVVLAGNPNVGKTSVFNALTGSRHQVGNYAGVTVESRTGTLTPALRRTADIELVDLPGTYSLTATSEDEAVAFRAITDRGPARPDVVVLVLDACNLARNLYLAFQVLELGTPTVLALNMMDVAEQVGLGVDPAALGRELGVPVVGLVARTGRGLVELVAAIEAAAAAPAPPALGPEVPAAIRPLADGSDPARARWLLSSHAAGTLELAGATPTEHEQLAALDPDRLADAVRTIVGARYAEVDRVLERLGLGATRSEQARIMAGSVRIDAVLTHPVLGLLVFVATMALVFQSIFTWATPLQDLIEAAMGRLADLVADLLGPGPLTDLVTQGVIAGTGNVIVFLPQIALLFTFIGLLEDSGYLARAAFLVDRMMARVGLHGRAFVPLLGGYACAIPAILSTRTIVGFRDRLVTMLMIPWMSCSARLPIYALVIGAFFEADRRVFGPFTVGGLVLLGMYALSTTTALLVGFLYKHTLLRGPTPPLVLELPPYRVPRLRNTALAVWDRSMDFVRNAGTVILACTIVLWALLSYPKPDPARPEVPAIEQSVGGRFGKLIEPALRPIGQDWRIGVGLVGSFAAREVLVSTLGLVWGLEAGPDDQLPLRRALREDRDPKTGKLSYGPLSGVALMIFFVYACQCMSTLAVIRRETRSWRWPLLVFSTMTAFAYLAALVVYQAGLALGWG